MSEDKPEPEVTFPAWFVPRNELYGEGKPIAYLRYDDHRSGNTVYKDGSSRRFRLGLFDQDPCVLPATQAEAESRISQKGQSCREVQTGGSVSGEILVVMVRSDGTLGDFFRCDVEAARRIEKRLSGLIKNMTSQDASAQSEEKTLSQSDAIMVHGMQIYPGEYYYGKPPDREGIWMRSLTKNVEQNNESVAYIVRDSDDADTEADPIDHYWIYCGPIAKLGTCVRGPENLIQGAAYNVCGGTWFYQFTTQARNNDGRMEDRHWMSTKCGHVNSFQRGQILERVVSSDAKSDHVKGRRQ